MRENYMVVIWSPEDLVSDVLCYAMGRLGHPCIRVHDIAEVAARLPADTARLILVVLPQIEQAAAVVCCADLQQRYTVIPIFLISAIDQPVIDPDNLPLGAVTHPHPIELKQFHQFLLQLIAQ